ncbi:IS66 family insertion sequence element accessory protein TnpB [Yersinia kristensenii]|nr:IS66 family insertion sequence element accessory protein TnpB [Yersinia kristensenii]MBW5818873.1 IS66 family insertion sequence element accessory protein TnpB [Yersinia kristensenii]MBW5831390.1 IS66 family insertion sequence element accessory protein TnpB [Yersinia kristensenii]MBW5844148.1 IS66 family insertion sequence element accessory protein TnpB [Yersinia kristensenii]
MMSLPVGTKIRIVVGITDMLNGFNGLATKVQTTLKDDPLSGHVFIFRGHNERSYHRQTAPADHGHLVRFRPYSPYLRTIHPNRGNSRRR